MSATPRRRPLVGAHISVAGGLEHVLPRARDIGAEAVQIFPSSPRQWRPSRYGEAEVRALGDGLAENGLPLFLHTIYLINLASPDPEQRDRSAAAVADALVFGARAGASGVVTHVGSHRGDGFEAAVPRVTDGVGVALETARDLAGAEPPPLLLETAAGGRGAVGNTPEDLGSLVERAGSRGRLGVCLDSAHLFAAGFPIHTREGLAETLDRFDAALGTGCIGLVHLNDSATPFAARRDRHANLWTGEIGRDGLGIWLADPRLRQVPFVLETPGFDGRGPDRRNLWRAKRLRGEGRRVAGRKPGPAAAGT